MGVHLESGQLHRHPFLVHGVCTKRVLATFLARPTQIAEQTPLGCAVSNGRTWDRTREGSQVALKRPPDLPLANSVRWWSGSSSPVAVKRLRQRLAQRSVLDRLACILAGGKQLPVPLGDDFDGAVDHFDGGLIVDRVRRHWYPAAHLSMLAREVSGMSSRSRCGNNEKSTSPSALSLTVSGSLSS